MSWGILKGWGYSLGSQVFPRSLWEKSCSSGSQWCGEVFKRWLNVSPGNMKSLFLQACRLNLKWPFWLVDANCMQNLIRKLSVMMCNASHGPGAMVTHAFISAPCLLFAKLQVKINAPSPGWWLTWFKDERAVKKKKSPKPEKFSEPQNASSKTKLFPSSF